MAISNAKWIGVGWHDFVPEIQKKFFINKCDKDAILQITGLGFFEVKLNGKPLTDYFYLPVASDFEPRDLADGSLYYRIPGTGINPKTYYYEFDIKNLLVDGENTLTVRLAKGWLGKGYTKLLRTIFSIEVDGKEIALADGTETWTDTEIRYNNIYTGEIIDYDARSGIYNSVDLIDPPKTKLVKAIGTPDKIARKLPSPKLVNEIDGRKIYDLGETISGLVKIKTSAKKGEKITLSFTELLTEENDLHFNFGIGAEWAADNGPQIMKDIFVCDGIHTEFFPTFTWHAFRYFDIDGEVDEFEIYDIHSDTPITSSFESDSEGLNFLYDSFVKTQLANMHSSFPSDCPHRERIGYTGDGQVCTTASMMMLDARNFYEKWIQDILDCQMEDGFVHHTAPYYGGAGGPGVWGSAIVYVPYYFYKHYGEIDILNRSFDGMCKWIDYLTTCLEGDLITHEVESSLSLGDWSNLGGVRIPAEFVNSCCFVKVLSLVSEIATIIGKTNDLDKFNELKKATTNAIIKKYRDENGITFASSVQGADAFAVWCGIAGEETIKNIAEIYKNFDHFDTGFMGTDILLDILFENGYQDIAFNLLNSREKGTFLYMKDNGATTLWEVWTGWRMSRCHPMFGGCSRHIFSSILGIRQPDGSTGYDKVIIDPRAPKNMNFAKGKMTTPHGEISVSWKRVDGEIQVEYSLPDGVTLVK